jgi:fused signal recognition particle receptor
MGWFEKFRSRPEDRAEQPPQAPPAQDKGAQDQGAPDRTHQQDRAHQDAPSAEIQPAGEPLESHAEAEDSAGLFSRFRRGLEKTSRLLRTDVRDLFKQQGELVDDAFLDRLFALAIRTDMGTESAMAIRSEVQTAFRGRVVTLDQVLDVIKRQLYTQLEQDQAPLRLAPQGPTVIMVVGVNGSGKTTTIAKLAHHFTRQGKQVVLGAGDTFRAAATEQLQVWAQRIGAEIVVGAAKSDPASVAHRAVARCREMGADVCIVDTAGRLQTQSNLMDELSKIRRVIQKQIPEAPHEVLLVLDATAGQNGISQARGFSEAAGCTGIVLAKLDGTAKGGVAIPIRRQFSIPVKLVGVGEKLDDLAPFDTRQFVDALFAASPAGDRSSGAKVSTTTRHTAKA